MRRPRRPGLRTRVTAGFGIGALLVSVAMAVLSFQLAQEFLLQERENSAVRATYLEAGIVQASLAADNPDFTAVLLTLDTGGKRRAMLHRDSTWYGRNADLSAGPGIPAALQRMVQSGRPAVQRIQAESGPALAIGVPLDARTGFYVIDSMRELDRSLQLLALVMTLVAAGTTAGGAALGIYAAGYVVRPITTVAAAAHNIRKGDLSTRLDPAAEPDLAQLATAFNEMAADLSLRLERDRRFAADVSHELRSPLQTLSAAAAVLTRRAPNLDPRSAAAAQLVAGEVSRFETLVTDLIELARGDRPAVLEPADVADLARGVCRSRGFDPAMVVTDPGARLVWQVEAGRFRQIVGNLIDNAVRHGGGLMNLHIGQSGAMGTLDVEDDGPGVSPADRKVIFDRFVRGRAASARGDGDGTGLGLAIVYQHVAAHGGSVSVTDRPGGGARFHVEIPMEPR